MSEGPSSSATPTGNTVTDKSGLAVVHRCKSGNRRKQGNRHVHIGHFEAVAGDIIVPTACMLEAGKGILADHVERPPR